MEIKELATSIMQLHHLLESKEIYYPENIYLIECYKGWVELIVKEKELEDK